MRKVACLVCILVGAATWVSGQQADPYHPREYFGVWSVTGGDGGFVWFYPDGRMVLRSASTCAVAATGTWEVDGGRVGEWTYLTIRGPNGEAALGANVRLVWTDVAKILRFDTDRWWLHLEADPATPC